jgi:hypothetical protein
MSAPLAEWTMDRLRVASRWARFVAIFGFIVAGMCILAVVGLLVGFGSIRLGLRVGFLIGACVLAAPMVAASALVVGYGNKVADAFREGAPALEKAMRILRHYFMLWTILSGLAALISLFSVLAGFVRG